MATIFARVTRHYLFSSPAAPVAWCRFASSSLTYRLPMLSWSIVPEPLVFPATSRWLASSSLPRRPPLLSRSDIELRFSKSSGPGGQHVNTSATKAEVRLSLTKASDLIPEAIATRLRRQANKAGELITVSSSHRQQHRNIDEAIRKMQRHVDSAFAAAIVEQRAEQKDQQQRRRHRRRQRSSSSGSSSSSSSTAASSAVGMEAVPHEMFSDVGSPPTAESSSLGSSSAEGRRDRMQNSDASSNARTVRAKREERAARAARQRLQQRFDQERRDRGETTKGGRRRNRAAKPVKVAGGWVWPQHPAASPD